MMVDCIGLDSVFHSIALIDSVDGGCKFSLLCKFKCPYANEGCAWKGEVGWVTAIRCSAS